MSRYTFGAHLRSPHPLALVYPPGLRDWPPLASLRNWLQDEFDLSRKLLHPDTKKRAPKTPKR